MPASVTTPFIVDTLIAVPGMSFVAIRSALTFVVIHASVPGWVELPCAVAAGVAAISSAQALPVEATPSAMPNETIRNLLFMSPPSLKPSVEAIG